MSSNCLLLTAMAVSSLVVSSGRATSLGAQQGQPTFRARTDLVRLDVVVVDQTGVPVRGLKQTDFTLHDERKTQPIALFEEVDHSLRPASATSVTFPLDIADNRTKKSQRLVVLVVDDMVIRPYLEQARELAVRVVSEIGPGALIALITTSGTVTVEVTEDTASILRAIDRMGPEKSGAPRIPRRHGDHVSEPTLAEVNGGDTTGCHPYLLENVARMVAKDTSARKVLVYITPYCDPLRGSVRGPTPHGDFSWVFESLRQAGVTVYAFDPRGALGFRLDQFRTADIVGASPSPHGPTTRSWSLVIASRSELVRLTEETGGFTVTNTDDYDAGLKRLLGELGHYYVLGFYPEVSKARRYQDLSVVVDRPGVTIRSKLGYVSGAEPRQKQDPIGGLSNGTIPDASLPLRLFVAPVGSAGRFVRVLLAFEVTVPRAQLLRKGDRALDDIEASIVAMSSKTTRVTQRLSVGRRISIPLSAELDANEITYEVLATMDLPPAEYQIRLAARSSAAAAGGSVFAAVDLTAHTGKELTIGGLVLGASSPTRVAEVSTDNLPQLPFVPTLRRAFQPTDSVRVWSRLFGWNSQLAARCRAELIGESGEIVRRIDFVPEDRRPSDSGGVVDLTLSLSDLSSGYYRIRVTATTLRGQQVRETGIQVRAPGSR